MKLSWKRSNYDRFSLEFTVSSVIIGTKLNIKIIVAFQHEDELKNKENE